MNKKPIGYHHCTIIKKYNLMSFISFCFLKLFHKCINHVAAEPLQTDRATVVSLEEAAVMSVKHHAAGQPLDRRPALLGAVSFGTNYW